jgi:hypothetical protein
MFDPMSDQERVGRSDFGPRSHSGERTKQRFSGTSRGSKCLSCPAEPHEEFGAHIRVLLEDSVHHINFHYRLRIADTSCHSA